MKTFKIIQFIQNGKTKLEIVPEDWEVSENNSAIGITFWPKTGLMSKIIDANSKLELCNSEQTKSIRKQAGLHNYKIAMEELVQMQARYDTDSSQSHHEASSKKPALVTRKRKAKNLSDINIQLPEKIQKNIKMTQGRGIEKVVEDPNINAEHDEDQLIALNGNNDFVLHEDCTLGNLNIISNEDDYNFNVIQENDIIESNAQPLQPTQIGQYGQSFLNDQSSSQFQTSIRPSNISATPFNPPSYSSNQASNLHFIIQDSNSQPKENNSSHAFHTHTNFNVSGSSMAIITEYFKEILNKCITFEKILKIFSTQMSNLRNDFNAFKQEFHNEPNTSKESINLNSKYHHIPLKSEDDISLLNVNIENDEFLKDFVEFFTKITGSNRTVAESARCTHEIINVLFDKTFWLRCSWKGGSNEPNVSKFALIKYDKVLSVIKEIVRKVSDKFFSDMSFQKIFESKMKNRHAANREKVSGIERKSAPKTRPKGLVYQKQSSNRNGKDVDTNMIMEKVVEHTGNSVRDYELQTD